MAKAPNAANPTMKATAVHTRSRNRLARAATAACSAASFSASAASRCAFNKDSRASRSSGSSPRDWFLPDLEPILFAPFWVNNLAAVVAAALAAGTAIFATMGALAIAIMAAGT